MDNHSPIKELKAKTTWALYAKYGLGEFTNWLTSRVDRISRDDVIQALKHPRIREYAKGFVKNRELKVLEVKQLLKESEEEGQ